MAATLGVAALVSLGLFLWALTQANEAQRQFAGTLRARQAVVISAARELADDPTVQVSLLREIDAVEPIGVRGWQTLSQDGLRRPAATAVLVGHSAPVGSAAFSPDGQRVVTASDDGTARVWYHDFLPRLWEKTSACLSAERRIELLDRDGDAAERNVQRCRRMVTCLQEGGGEAFDGCYREFRRSQGAED